ncbi:uncharacterized protein LOC120212219 [Hibiscus syriacus]|uniref:uncharacterized protein LOC120212219 n=1 Tax=Hibiscus syriacus TaxID=106335 RepID=UPI0019249335|nr:uncharacterized protein LOC120212219 [Hibiscus syriacus]
MTKHSGGRTLQRMRIDFMGPFPTSFGDLYILLEVDYVSKWVEAISTPKNDSKTVLQFLHKIIFTCFGTPRAIINDGGTHFDNKLIAKALKRYRVRHWIAMAIAPRLMDKLKSLIGKSNRSLRKWKNKVPEEPFEDFIKSKEGITKKKVPELMSFDDNALYEGLERGAKFVAMARMAAVVIYT